MFVGLLISLLLNALFGILLFIRGEEVPEPDAKGPKKPVPLSAASEMTIPRRPKPRPVKNKPVPEPTISWAAYNALAIAPSRPVLPQFQGWLTDQAKALNFPTKKLSELMKVAADADDAYTRVEHQSMTRGANGEWNVRISPAQMTSVVKTMEAGLSKLMDAEATRALVEVAEGWVPKEKNIEYHLSAQVNESSIRLDRTLPEAGLKTRPSTITARDALDPNGLWNQWLGTSFPQQLNELQAGRERR